MGSHFWSLFYDPLGIGYGDALFGKGKKSDGPAPALQPAAPAPGDALAQAQKDATERRRAAVLSGGDTQISGFGSSIPSTSLGVHNLLGD